ncbi:hypothetical protein TNCV_4372081 [Trichonephila clavipes]|nr:hypothetical protein TNCV_4372081 [Trichonephila clavipes]
MNETTQLSSRNEQLNSATRTKQLNSPVGTKQLNSPVGTKQLNSALPSTACNRLHRFYSRIGFFYLLATILKLVSDNGSEFIFDIFEHLSERLGIRHVKTVVYRPQANRTEPVNCDLEQMIENYANEQHDTWDQFLREFAYAIRTAVN